MKRFLLAGLLATFALTACSMQPNDYALPGQPAIGSDGYSVTVNFKDVANLVPNSAVEMDNVVVGTVAAIRVSNWQVQVSLRLLKSANVPADATFSIGQKTLLGAQYVDVSGPSSGTRNGATLHDGEVVSAARTGTYPATEQVLSAVALLLNNGGLSQIQTITSQLSIALQNHVPDTRDLVRRTNDLLGVLDANKDQAIHALEALNRLSSGLAADRSALGTALDRLGPGIRALEQERPTLVKALTLTGQTSAQASVVIEAGGAGLVQTVNALQPILANLGSVASSLPEALKLGLTIPFPAMTTMNGLRGDYENLFTTLDLRGSSLANSWLAGLLTGQIPSTSAAPTATSQGAQHPSGLAGLPLQVSPTQTAPGSGSSPAAPSGVCLLGLLGQC